MFYKVEVAVYISGVLIHQSGIGLVANLED